MMKRGHVRRRLEEELEKIIIITRHVSFEEEHGLNID
jgi:hypothetical protein